MITPSPLSTIDDAVKGDVPAPFGSAFAVKPVRFDGPVRLSVRGAVKSPPPANGDVVAIFKVLNAGVYPILAIAVPATNFVLSIVAAPINVGSIVPPALVRTIVEVPVTPNGTLAVIWSPAPATASCPATIPLIPFPVIYPCAFTNAVVAMLVSLSDVSGVGAVGLPVNVGDASNAYPGIVKPEGRVVDHPGLPPPVESTEFGTFASGVIAFSPP